MTGPISPPAQLPYGSWCNPDYEKVSTTLTWFPDPGLGMIRDRAQLLRPRLCGGHLGELLHLVELRCRGGINHYGVASAFTSTSRPSRRHRRALRQGRRRDVRGHVETSKATWARSRPGGARAADLLPRPRHEARPAARASAAAPDPEALRLLFKTDLADHLQRRRGVALSYGIFGGYPAIRLSPQHARHRPQGPVRQARAHPGVEMTKASQIRTLHGRPRRLRHEGDPGAAGLREATSPVDEPRRPRPRRPAGGGGARRERGPRARAASPARSMARNWSRGRASSSPPDTLPATEALREMRRSRLAWSKPAAEFFAEEKQRVEPRSSGRWPTCTAHPAKLSPRAAKYRGFATPDDWTY